MPKVVRTVTTLEKQEAQPMQPALQMEKELDIRFSYNYYNQATKETVAVDILKRGYDGLYTVTPQKNGVADYLAELSGKNFEKWQVPASRLQGLKKPCINQKFSFYDNLVRNCFLGKSHVLCVGDAGNGKSHTYLEILKQFNWTEDIEYVCLKTSTTAKGLYDLLKNNSNKVIILDDVDDVVTLTKCVSIIKSACDTGNKRPVSWNTNAGVSTFCFTGRVMIISNIPMEKIDEALRTRFEKVNVRMTLNEKLARINALYLKMDIRDIQLDEDGEFISQSYEDLSEDERKIVWRTVLEAIEDGTISEKKVCVRMMLKAMQFYSTQKELDALNYQLSQI